jgi:hypothetical protein
MHLFLLNWLWLELQVVFQWISSISFGFLVKLDCSKTASGGSSCQLSEVVSCCTLRSIVLYICTYFFNNDSINIPYHVFHLLYFTAIRFHKNSNWLEREITQRKLWVRKNLLSFLIFDLLQKKWWTRNHGNNIQIHSYGPWTFNGITLMYIAISFVVNITKPCRDKCLYNLKSSNP